MLIIAEKPSVARSIAAALHPRPAQLEGCYQAGEHVVTYLFGHVLEQATPETYNEALKRWTFNDLPILIKPDQWRLMPKEGAADQIRVIKTLLRSADTVVNAGDADREGQMLVDELLEYLGWKGKTLRILLSDTTPASVRKAFDKIQPNSNFRPLYEAALCRSRADWLVGMNLTRAATLRIGGKVVSVGRVQTPTLGLVVARDREIEGHAQRVYFTLHATCHALNCALVLTHDPDEKTRIWDPEEARRVAESLRGKKIGIEIEESTRVERSPLPFMLATFQSAAEKHFGWGAAESLKVLQALYEKQLVTYPRTDCPYLPLEMKPAALPLANAVLDAGHFPEVAAVRELLAPKDTVYDNAKVAEHHGLAPTRKLPGAELEQKLLNGWRLVTRQFLASLAPDYRALIKSAHFTHNDRLFRAKGETPINAESSWRLLIPKEDIDPPLALPHGHADSLSSLVQDVEVKQARTKPPKRYTEASLIEDMRSASKYVKDERLKAILKKVTGIGTGATQAAIIETLKERKFIVTSAGRGKVKTITSTPLGRYVVDALPPTLSDPSVTAVWEDALDRIATSGASAGDFMTRIEAYVCKYVDLIRDKTMPPLPPEALRVDAPDLATAKKRLARRSPKERVRKAS